MLASKKVLYGAVMLLLLPILLVWPVAARNVITQSESPVITAQNITRLRRVAGIGFENLAHINGRGAGIFQTGWFVMDDRGSLFAVASSGEMIVVDESAVILQRYSIGPDGDAVVDTFDSNVAERPPFSISGAAFGNVGDRAAIVSVHSDFSRFFIVYYPLLVTDLELPSWENALAPFLAETAVLQTRSFSFFPALPNVLEVRSEELPVGVWVSGSRIWLELLSPTPGQASSIMWLPHPLASATGRDTGDEIGVMPDMSTLDSEAVVRLGRIPPPFVVTSSQDGVIKRWNLETGEVTASAQVENGPAVFGQINATASHLAWRDPYSDDLYLLDFETGENRVVADLGGQYVQFFFLGANADVILGVHLQDEPIVVAWDVTSGRQYDLGAYRPCSRVPDMARLSQDGTTLVIGCDSGLDIWRIAD